MAHKELFKAEDTTSFNHAPPVLTEDRGGRGAARSPCCRSSLLFFWPHFSPQHKVGRLREVSSRSLSHFSIRRAVSRAPHSLWTDKPHEAKVYILCCGVFDHGGRLKSELKSTLNAKWFAVSECTVELPVPLDF